MNTTPSPTSSEPPRPLRPPRALARCGITAALLLGGLLVGCSSTAQQPAQDIDTSLATAGGTQVTDRRTGVPHGPPAMPTEAPTDTAAVVGGPGEDVEFVVTSHAFGSLPARIGAGSTLQMTNGSADDFHRLLVFRLADTDTRSAEELAALPFEPDETAEAGNGLPAGLGGTLAGVLSAPPGTPGRQPTGEVGLAMEEVGRVAILDTLPVEAEIDAAIEAENSGDFSGLQEGPFHYQQGELAIIEVVAVEDGDGQGNDSHEERPHEEALFYGNFTDEVLLFAGATTQDFCTGNQPTNTARVSTHADGSETVEVDADNQPFHLYASPLGGPELIDATCEAMFDDDPDTVPLAPYATGEGRFRIRIEQAPDGSAHVINSATGSVTSPAGPTWQVRGWADLEIVDGMPLGDPATFQGLAVQRTGGGVTRSTD